MTVSEALLTERIPSEFRHYWEVIERPNIRLARAAALRVLRFDILPSEERVLGYAHGYYDADPVADDFVDEVYLGRSAKEGRRMLDQALAEGADAVSDAPESLLRLFAHVDRDPDWLDRERVTLGAKVFRRFGVTGLGISGAGELVGFTENPAIKPMSLHGGFMGERALYRLMETARFWIDTTEPGGLEAGAAGRAVSIRVRIMHSVIRRRLMGHPEWDCAAWGVPISQSEMIGPLIGTSLPVALAAKVSGLRTTTAEVDALLHFWRYVGHIMGVNPRWYPANIGEGIQYLTMFTLKRSFTGGDDFAEIIESYPRAFVPKPGGTIRKRIRDEVNYRAQLGYTRFALGSLYRKYDMPNAWPWALHPFAQWPVNFAASTLARHNDRAADTFDRYQRWRRETWWRNEMGDRKGTYTPAERFRR